MLIRLEKHKAPPRWRVALLDALGVVALAALAIGAGASLGWFFHLWEIL